MAIRARYVGQGEYYHGIPARDLTDEDLERLTDEQRALVQSGPLYEPVPTPKRTAPKDETKEDG